ncbi:AAA family ATPase [Spirosoma foliorum]|uniref:AAA family ATPase n=2 Tax=Spirosoma foliorum TaxID=2710596 RepID=A0A7G5H763_9BACT|nr:AAA family ATPase [Spirosoma foliorum]
MENTAPNTNNFLNWVEIKNFKSIKDLRLDCKRVNVFIGKPNVGKSNILEGLGLLGAGYDTGKFLKGSVRYQNIKHLFWDNDTSLFVKVSTDRQGATLFRLPSLRVLLNDGSKSESPPSFSIRVNDETSREIDGLGNLIKITHLNNELRQGDAEQRRDQLDNKLRIVKKYDFANLTEFENSFQGYLLPPSGVNLYEVIRRNKELWSEFAKLFVYQQLELVLYDEKQEFILQKRNGPFVIQYPFFSIADTFRRFMFYITAIESNKNSVIVFEEPEVHSFPPYTQEMAYRMIYDEDNQYFISTHSPYLLHTLIENLEDSQLNVYVTYYEDYETKVKLLTPENLREVLDFSIDVFFNLDKFLVNA